MRLLLPILLLLSISSSSWSQDFVAEKFTQQEGLKSPSIFCIFKDTQGYLWIGTNTGVARFDGQDFEYFEVKNGLTGYSVYQVHEDSNGRIWFLTDSGEPNFYYKGRIHSPSTDQYLKDFTSNSFLYGFYEDDDESVWIGSFNSGYKCLKKDNTVIKADLKELGPQDRRITNFWPYQEGQLLVSTTQNIVCIDKKTQKKIWQRQLFKPTNHFMRSIRLNTEEILSFSGNKGVVFNIVKKEVTSTFSVPEISEIIKVKRLTDGEVVVGSRDGLFEFNGKTLVPHLLNKSVRNNSISDVYVDPAKNYWLATLNNGLVKFNNFLITKDKRFSDINEPVHSLNSDKYENLYIGTQGNGFYKFNKKLSFTNLKKDKSKIRDVISLSKDTTLVITENKVVVMENGNIIPRGVAIKGYALDTTSSDLYLAHINGVTKTSTSALIDAIKEKDDESFRHYFNNNIGSSKHANGVAIHSGEVYIGTKKGLQKCVQSNCELIQNKVLNEKTYILKVLPIQNNQLVLATLGKGVIIHNIKTQETKQISTQNGLADDFIIDIFRDEESYIWCKHSLGLSYLKEQSGEYNVRNFGDNDGLKEVVINKIGSYKGEILLATNNGVLSFNKLNIEKKTKIDQNFDFKSFTTKGQKKSITSSEINLQSKTDFSIDYNLVSFRLGKNITYYYRLLPYSNSWIPSSSEIVSYPGLKEGEYNLQVYAQNEQGTKSETYELLIKAKDPWYSSTEAWFFYMILLSISVWGIFQSGILKFNKKEIIELWYKLKNIRKTEVLYPPIEIKTIDGNYVKIQAKDILLISAAGNYVEYHTSTNKHVVRTTLKTVENNLVQIKFIQKIHRSYLINLKKVKSYTTKSVLIDKIKVPVGASYLSKLK